MGDSAGPTHDLAHTLLPLDLRGYYFIFQGALPITKDPRHYPQETDLQASPTEKILRAMLYTHVYTVVYTRVYSPLLGRRDTLGSLHLGHRYFYLRRMLPHDLALAR